MTESAAEKLHALDTRLTRAEGTIAWMRWVMLTVGGAIASAVAIAVGTWISGLL